jgi:Domain of unknown function (DUF5916)
MRAPSDYSRRGLLSPACSRASRLIAIAALALLSIVVTPPGHANSIEAVPIDIDADFAPLDDVTWSLAAPQPLIQRAPHPGEPTLFTTNVRILAGRSHLYVRVDCTDPHAHDIVTHSLLFDGDQSFDDHVVLILDTFGRHRTAYEFDVNAAGSRSDGLISPAAILTNYDWNGDWRAIVTKQPNGWIAYIAIDTHSLQFPREAESSWGINIGRYVPRDQLSLQWAGTGLDASITDLSRVGELRGVGNIAAASGWTFSPYGVLRYSNHGDGAAQTGFDVRYNLSPELAAVATVNPDFAEAEVDAQQINLTPYALFKPEKRAFFLDGSNQFTFASGIGNIFIPFYSRTIGLVDATPVRIDEGIKLIGQSGPVSIGALAVRSGNSVVADPQNLFVGRLAYDIDEHWRVGTLVTDGDPTGASRNRFEGIDSVWRTATFFGDKNLNVSAWAARSTGDAKPGQHAGWGTYIDYPNDLWRWVISANTFGDALNPAMGFLPRPGTRQYDFYVGHFPRASSENAWIHQSFYEMELEQVDDLNGHTESRKLTVTPFNILTDSAEHLEWHWSPQYENLAQPFAITDRVTLPAGQYHFQRMHFQAESSTAGGFQAGTQLEVGGFYDGTLTQTIPYLRWTTPNNRWRFEFNNETDWVSLREGNFVQRLYQLKASYSFDTDLAFSSFTQYDTDTHHVGVNAQIRWMIAPQRDLYVVFNHEVAPSLAEPNAGYLPLSNSVTVKFQWNFYL